MVKDALRGDAGRAFRQDILFSFLHHVSAYLACDPFSVRSGRFTPLVCFMIRGPWRDRPGIFGMGSQVFGLQGGADRGGFA